MNCYMSAVPSVTVANTTCHLPRSDAFRIFRHPVSGDLPWPGLVFGLTVLATWVWCIDQVTLPTLIHIVGEVGGLPSTERTVHKREGAANRFVKSPQLSEGSRTEMMVNLQP